ncbi:MAG: hypothetical protein E7496_02775 [Ruminococcus sp.]|nr:hypothetical protein [Ruminococcus sp.]
MMKYLTPCGIITLRDNTGMPVEFSVCKRKKLFPKQYLFYDTDYEYPVQTQNEYEIHISAKHLKAGINYILRIHDCECKFGDSDENTFCNYVFKNYYHLSIGAYDPNDDSKWYQMLAKYQHRHQKDAFQFDESEFEQYMISMLADCSGYAFHLLNNPPDEIIFHVAWIAHFTERPAELRFIDEEDLKDEFERYITCLTT